MGKSLMVSSHILTELGEMSTSIGIIEKGKLLYAGSLADALNRVRGGERIAIKLEAGADADAAAEDLGKDVRVAKAARDNGQIMVDLTPGEHGHHFLLEILVSKGHRIAAFTPQQVKLEDAFLKLTKGVLQ
jgi:ABC-2 type transport system ATP-binding protein